MCFKKQISSLILLLLSSYVYSQQTKVYYVDLSPGAEITADPVKTYSQVAANEGAERVLIYPDIQFQTLTGIGATFNEIGGEALMHISKTDREALMRNMFSKEDGAGFSFCRTALGASDFGISAYSYSEIPDDYSMKNFSIDRDRKYVIPYIQLGYKFNPLLKVFASPWSPPGWMKYSGMMDKGNEMNEKNMLKQDRRIYNAYALYFAKYSKAYAAEGIKIDRILIQNEQDINTKYPSCRMPVEQMAELVQKYVRPNFIKENIKTELWAGTFRAAGELEGTRFMSDLNYSRGFDGVGVQYMDSRFISDMHWLDPALKMMHTESVCFNGDNSIEQSRSRLNEIASYINSGTENFCYWNMVLNETGKSGWDWKQNSLITIDRLNKKVIYNPDYAVIYLVSKFLRPGVVRIANSSKSKLISVKDGKKIVVLIQNDASKIQHKEFKIDGNTYLSALPPNSICAIEIESTK